LAYFKLINYIQCTSIKLSAFTIVTALKPVIIFETHKSYDVITVMTKIAEVTRLKGS